MSHYRTDERNFENRIESLERSIAKLQEGHRLASKQSTETTFAFYDFTSKLFAGADFQKAVMHRYLPIRVYIHDDTEIDRSTGFEWVRAKPNEELWVLVHRLLATEEFFYLFELPEEKGSWKKISGALSRWFGTAEDGADRLRRIEAAANIVMLDKPTAEVNKAQAEAAALLIGALKEYDAAAVTSGNFAILKNTTPEGRKVLMMGQLSQASLKKLEENSLEQMKPENLQNLLLPTATVIDQEQLSHLTKYIEAGGDGDGNEPSWLRDESDGSV